MRIDVDNDNYNNVDKNLPTLEDLDKFFKDMEMIDFISVVFEIKLRNIL